MAQPIEPYLFEPLMTTEELRDLRERMGNDEERVHEENRDHPEDRIGHNRWCLCGNCPSMPTAKEAICCKEISEATDKMGSNVCITIHPSFNLVCLDREVLRTALVAMSDVRFDRYAEPIQPRTFRLAAYRQFTWWIHSRLGRSVRRIIPACAVAEIRRSFPEETGQYTGFQEADETNDY